MNRSVFTLSDGRRLSWCEAGEGPVIVLLHGWSMSSAVFAELVSLLAQSFRLLVPDLPGHGQSDPAERPSLATMSEDLEEWINTATDGPICLAGWSLGGMLSLELAARSLIQIERLILLGTTPRFTNADDWPCGLPATQVLSLTRNLSRRFEATLGDFFFLSFAGEDISPERLLEIRRFAVKGGVLPDKATATALLTLLETQDQRHLLPGIVQPCLVLHGEQDRIAPITAGRRLAVALKNGRIVELSGVAHGPFLSRPGEVAARIAEFCQWVR